MNKDKTFDVYVPLNIPELRYLNKLLDNRLYELSKIPKYPDPEYNYCCELSLALLSVIDKYSPEVCHETR